MPGRVPRGGDGLDPELGKVLGGCGGCASAPSQGGGAGLAGVFVLGLVGLLRRRR